jgi:DNA (cytosine-5)-methyltransferase 1
MYPNLGASAPSNSPRFSYPACASHGAPAALEFFAGSGLVAEGLQDYFRVAWANDICAKKARVYTANHGDEHFHLGSITDVKGGDLPPATLSWASFPCQDLSLAGLTAGIHGKRSGLVWEWLRIMDEMAESPPLLVAENVAGLVSAHEGRHYRALHEALVERGYRVGALLLNASHWVPQSRLRVFVVAVKEGIPIPPELTTTGPTWAHPPALVKAGAGLDNRVWWSLPEPPERTLALEDVIEWDAGCDPLAASARNIALVPERHKIKLDAANIALGYKRTRHGKQVLELRFDGLAGCLRTPEGGSSRQVIVLRKGERFLTRLLTARETARLMGAPETYALPGSYNDGYRAMGDAVAVPVVLYLAQHLLAPLAKALHVESR